MRLIDVDAMNEELFYKQVGGKDSLITAESAFEMVDAQPTAYDVDKVISELKRDKFVESECILSDVHQGYNAGLNRAIEIVKGGGVE